MSSQLKSESKVLPEIVTQVGESFLEELGVARFKWIIKDFKEHLDLGETIHSPVCELEIIKPYVSPRSFHLEMEIPNKNPCTNCPIFLVNGCGLLKIALESYSPNWKGFDFNVSLITSIVQTSLRKKHVMTLTLPSQKNYYLLPKEVTIEIRVALCQSTQKIVL
jgi:hypothetical protein